MVDGPVVPGDARGGREVQVGLVRIQQAQHEHRDRDLGHVQERDEEPIPLAQLHAHRRGAHRIAGERHPVAHLGDDVGHVHGAIDPPGDEARERDGAQQVAHGNGGQGDQGIHGQVPPRCSRRDGRLAGPTPSVAARVGFEPTGLAPGAFQERCHKPLGHLAAGEHTSGRRADRRRIARYRWRVIRAPFADRALADGHLIDLRDVVKVYETGAGPFRALKASSPPVDAGEFVGLIGKSGSGKTTLINMITGIDRPTAGEVVVAGTPRQPVREPHGALARPDASASSSSSSSCCRRSPSSRTSCCRWTSAGCDARGALRAGDAPARAGRDGRPGAQAPGGALRRPAAARRDRPRARERPADHRRRRADRQPRLETRPRRSSSCSRRSWRAGKTIVMVTHDNDLAARTRRTVHMVDGAILDGTLAETPAA